MRLYSKVSLNMTYNGDTPVIDYDIQYASGERATGNATRSFWMQLMSQFLPAEMTLLQQAILAAANPSTGTTPTTTPTPSTTTPDTTTNLNSTTVPGVTVKAGL